MSRGRPHGHGVVYRQRQPQVRVVDVCLARRYDTGDLFQTRHEWKRQVMGSIGGSEAYDLAVRGQIGPFDGLAKREQDSLDQACVARQETVSRSLGELPGTLKYPPK